MTEEKTNEQRLDEMEENADNEKAARKKKPGPKPKPAMYENLTNHNIFTENGRCAPGKSIEMTTAHAKLFGDQVKKC